MVVDPGCMKCLDCVSVCPKEALYFGPGRPAWRKRAAGWVRARTPRAEELALAAVFAVAFFALRGVYGVVPFLLALGLAGVGAAGLVTLVRMWRRSDFNAFGLALRRGGELTRAGRWYAVGALGFAALVLHRGLIQLSESRARNVFAEMHAVQAAFLGNPRARLAGEDAARVSAGLTSAGLVERYGLLETPGNAARLAWLELLAGEPAEFERRMRAALAEPGGDTAGACRSLGLFLEARGRRDEAVAVYRAGLRERPDAALSDRLAQLLWGLGRREEACAVYREARAAEPELPALAYNLGVALASLGDLAAAAEAFRDATRLDPTRIEALENLADVLAASGDTAGAIEGYRALLALHPGHAGALAALAALDPAVAPTVPRREN
jgi:tetratricopeptide (TPR) repeat protein